MATYTPNLNLGKPEVTDAFGNFRQLFNDNMDILDNGGGGGSGGHTIVNPSGSDMPAEGKLQFTGGVTVTDDSVNGKTVVDISGGGGNVYGAFIDTNRLITSGQYSSGSPLSYTATEDCFVYGVCTLTNNTSGSVSIDGVQVGGWYNGGGTTAYNFGFLVKNGQTITASQTFSGNSDYKVYGLTQGTSGIFTPIIYSDTERVVGVWRDNKPLYQRTWEFGSSVLVSYSSWTNTVVDSSDIENIITVKAKHADGTCFEGIMADPTVSGHTLVGLQTTRNGAEANVKTLTLQYTKISDVAGSGNWNTDGVPTVHYSTSEQVIGTWENGKPLYQQTVIFDTGNVASNIDFNISAYMPVNSVVRDSSFTLDFSFNGDTYHGANWGGAYVEINGVSYLSFNIGSAVYNKHVELTIKYTKTTD